MARPPAPGPSQSPSPLRHPLRPLPLASRARALPPGVAVGSSLRATWPVASRSPRRGGVAEPHRGLWIVLGPSTSAVRRHHPDDRRRARRLELSDRVGRDPARGRLSHPAEPRRLAHHHLVPHRGGLGRRARPPRVPGASRRAPCPLPHHRQARRHPSPGPRAVLSRRSLDLRGIDPAHRGANQPGRSSRPRLRAPQHASRKSRSSSGGSAAGAPGSDDGLSRRGVGRDPGPGPAHGGAGRTAVRPVARSCIDGPAIRCGPGLAHRRRDRPPGLGDRDRTRRLVEGHPRGRSGGGSPVHVLRRRCLPGHRRPGRLGLGAVPP